MGEEWQRKPKRDWSLEPKGPPLGAPPVPRDVFMRIQAGRIKTPPDPFVLMNGGLREGDHLILDWVDDKGLQLNGCRLWAYRYGTLLKWATSGWGRDGSGKCLYMPFLTSLSAVDDFVDMLGVASGYTQTVLEESKTRRRFVLESATSESRRLISGDYISFDWEGKALRVQRSQGTVNMNLYRPKVDDKIGVIMSCSVNYISLYHHPSVIARILAEVNALQSKGLGSNVFLATHR